MLQCENATYTENRHEKARRYHGKLLSCQKPAGSKSQHPPAITTLGREQQRPTRTFPRKIFRTAWCSRERSLRMVWNRYTALDTVRQSGSLIFVHSFRSSTLHQHDNQTRRRQKPLESLKRHQTHRAALLLLLSRENTMGGRRHKWGLGKFAQRASTPPYVTSVGAVRKLHHRPRSPHLAINRDATPSRESDQTTKRQNHSCSVAKHALSNWPRTCAPRCFL